MKELYKGFKKVAEDDKSARLSHESGHELTIAKSGLSKSNLKMLESLPLHQAEGTNPTTDDELAALEKEMSMAKEDTEPFTPKASFKPEYESKRQVLSQKEVDQQLEQRQQEQQLGQQQAAEALTKPEDFQKTIEQKSLAQQPVAAQPTEQPVAQPEKRAVAAQAQPIAKPEVRQRTPEEIYADPKANIEDRYAAKMQIAENITKQIRDEDEKFQAAVANDKIDPNRIYANQNFPQKVATIFGLLLGGLGAGLSGGPNVVQQMLDKQIQMDVDEQKRQKDQKLNLYKIHLERLGNERDAHIAAANSLKQVALLRMDRMLGLLGNNPMAQQRLLAERTNLAASIADGQLKITNSKMAELSKQQMMSGEPSAFAEEMDPRRERAVKIGAGATQQRLYARNPQEAAKAQEKANQLTQARDVLTELGNVYKEAAKSTTGISFDLKERAESLSTQAKLMIANAQNISPKLVDELEKIIGSIGFFKSFKPGETNKLELQRRQGISLIDRELKALTGSLGK